MPVGTVKAVLVGASRRVGGGGSGGGGSFNPGDTLLLEDGFYLLLEDGLSHLLLEPQ